VVEEIMHQNYPVSTPIQLSQTLKALRHAAGLSQEAAGQLLGVNQKRLARIESAPERTSFEQISRLVTALGGRLEVSLASSMPAKQSAAKGSEKASSTW
jgi:HTH-type transcriptional regulator / antitoxin HipB